MTTDMPVIAEAFMALTARKAAPRKAAPRAPRIAEPWHEADECLWPRVCESTDMSIVHSTAHAITGTTTTPAARRAALPDETTAPRAAEP